MKFSRNIFAVLVVFWMASCSPVRVFLEKNEVAEVADYKTFFVINQYYDKDAFESPVLEDNLQNSLTEGMKSFGFEQDMERPDLIVRYNTNLTDRQKEVNTAPMMNPYYGLGWYSPWMMPWGSNMGGFRVENYDMGELVVDFIDTRQDKVVMRISAVGEINKPQQKSKNLKTSVEKILKTFSKKVTS
ncbi:protein of unknown function [Cyclobacterium lianum]|uniref:DUF4136 domain-containing protein n=1 Tax=Cyclobacterium lianum TaxID=388280 RepID=A0A1M7QIC6_9BACT|nr:DUF4136 domain-containing protein [Cyclobacterium lianum]SHN30828.1 protein of unknown function [Cyclobacterium lianum]